MRRPVLRGRVRRGRARSADARPAGGSEQGSGVVEFVLMTVLLVLLLFVVLQTAVWFYARNIAAAAAADAARYAATTGGQGGVGARRADSLIGDGLSRAAASDLVCTQARSVDAASGLPTATVRCRGRVRAALSPFAIPLTIDVHSSALIEKVP